MLWDSQIQPNFLIGIWAILESIRKRAFLQKLKEGSQGCHCSWCPAFPPPKGGTTRKKLLCLPTLNIYFNLVFIVTFPKHWNAIHCYWKVTTQIKCSVFYHTDKSLLGRIINTFKVHYVFQVHDSSALGKSIISWHMFKCCNLSHLW